MKSHIKIDSEICKGCQLCIPECPEKVIQLGSQFNKKGWIFATPVHNDACIGCKKCAIVCPDLAIQVFKEE